MNGSLTPPDADIQVAQVVYTLSNIGALYDGKSASSDSIQSSVDLRVSDGKIVSVTAHDSRVPVGSDHVTIECSQYAVTPGLIDCHNHVTILGSTGPDMDLVNSPLGLLYVEKILHSTLVNGGVTTARDMGGATHAVKRLVDEGVMIGPRLIISICMLSTTGGHADFRGLDRCHDEVSRVFPPGPGRPSSIVDGPWECRRRVREIVACGADFIKICTSPGVHSFGGGFDRRDFTVEEVAAICDEAAAKGLRVAAHAHSKRGIEDAIAHGIKDLQHISFMDKELVERADRAGCTVTPTSWIIHQTAVQADSLVPAVADKVKRVGEVHAHAVAYARSGGLPILAGTDPISRGMHGRNYMELAYLIRDGLTALEAWYASTGQPARQLGLNDIGTIEAGKRADLLVCDKGALEEPSKLANGLVEVIKGGCGYRGQLAGLPRREFRRAAQELLEAAPQREPS